MQRRPIAPSANQDNRNPVVLLPNLQILPDSGDNRGNILSRNLWRTMAPAGPLSRAKPQTREIVACECTPEMEHSVCEECRRRSVHEWSWGGLESGKIIFQNNRKDITFNPGFSVGTAAVRGEVALQKGYHHYWEIEMSTEVYGTDMMIGVGTDQIDLNGYSHSFVSLIGMDKHGWGLSYSGDIHHAGKSQKYSERFGQYAVIGVHLDMWAGTLEFYLNRKPLGIAFRNLQGHTLFPMISSTAARSGMNLIFSRSYPSSLQIQSLLSIGKNIGFPKNTSIFKCLELPPGLIEIIKNNYWWIVTNKTAESQENKVTAERTKMKKREVDRSAAKDTKQHQVCKNPAAELALQGVVTRSRSRLAADIAAGPAEAAKRRSRSKSIVTAGMLAAF
ncbi:unnamed protein product [Allacma fusca]|uniref:B30.2/SPRY domain-containing protein n=1 Tax=Allacma fusca TaxID=39272 RepID=A0A8J2LPT6_9HEXA|nr:unnamed protein product [Allacma fusca]